MEQTTVTLSYNKSYSGIICISSWNCGVRTSRGVGVLLYDIDATVKEISSDDFGRILFHDFTIFHLYGTNNSNMYLTINHTVGEYV
jgi:nitrate reductase beta subunit